MMPAGEQPAWVDLTGGLREELVVVAADAVEVGRTNGHAADQRGERQTPESAEQGRRRAQP